VPPAPKRAETIASIQLGKVSGQSNRHSKEGGFYPRTGEVVLGKPFGGAGSGFEETNQFDSDLLQAPLIGFAFFSQKRSYFRREFHLGFGVLLEFQIHHFFNQADQRLRSHNIIFRKAATGELSALWPAFGTAFGRLSSGKLQQEPSHSRFEDGPWK
jgi:hypothetical protein